MTPTFKAVLFDHDGTLVDSEAVHHAIWLKVLQPYGVVVSLADYERYYAGVPTAANALDLVERLGVPATPAALETAKHAATRAYLQTASFPLMPGVAQALATLKAQGLRMAVVTGSKTFAVAATLRAHGLEAMFETTVSADDVVHSKPAPDCYLLAMQRMGLQAQDCVAFEDTEHGVAAAVAAGVQCVAIPTALSAQHDFSKATVIRGSMAQAVEWTLAQP